MCLNGLGTEKNYDRTLNLFKKSGSSLAQSNIGYMCEKGLGVDKNLNKAIKWYKKAADQGLEVAKKKLKKLGQ